MSQPDPVMIPGARLLLEQMVRLNDIQIEAVGHLRQKSRAYLSVGALAVAAGIALLAIPDAEGEIHFGVVGGVALALALFGLSAVLAVRAERATPIPDAPSLASLASLMADQDQSWSDDQLALWIALEYRDSIVPAADDTNDRIAHFVDRQLLCFLIETGVLGVTLIVALLT